VSVNERIRIKSDRVMHELHALGFLVQLQVFRETAREFQEMGVRMEKLLAELDPDPKPTTSEPRATIAPPAPKVHKLAAAASSLRVVRGGGHDPFKAGA
jgi:hypothetical protein